MELAGTLAEIARHTLTRDFRHIDTRKARILLIEAGPRVLAAFTEDLADKARKQLEHLGVEVHTGKPVTEIGADFLTFGDQRIAARTILWAAGVAASPLGKQLGAELDRAGRVRVQPDLSLPAHPEVFVAGDLASIEQDGKPVPGVAPAAKQMGARVAHNILARIDGRQRPTPFHYTDFGALATIGRHSAIAQLPKLRFSGVVGVVVLARAPHLFPDRVPQPAHRAHQLGLGLFHLRARGAHHPRQRSGERLMAAKKKAAA